MKNTEIRIVGLNPDTIFVQSREKSPYNTKEWTQTVMTFDEFEKLMKEEFPQYMAEYKGSAGYDMANFFYEYGYDNATADTYIFR